jgi:hypothetical protein
MNRTSGRSDHVRAAILLGGFAVAILGLSTLFGFGSGSQASCASIPSGSWFRHEYCAQPVARADTEPSLLSATATTLVALAN